MRIFVSLVFLLFLQAFPAQASLAVTPSKPRQDLSGRMSVLVDDSRALTLAEVADPANASRFEALPGNLNLGFTDAVVWLKFDLMRNKGEPQQWWLEVRPSVIDYLTLYVPNSAGGYTARQSGDSLPFAQRDLAYQNAVFMLALPADRLQTFYLRLSGKDTMAARLRLWTPSAFAVVKGNERLLYGLLFGVHVAMVLASLWFWQATRDSAYASFACFTLASMTCIAASAGLLQQYLLPDAPYWHDPAIALSLIFSVAFGLQFVLQFVEVWRYFPRLASRFRLAVWSYCLLATIVVALGHFKFFLPLFQISIGILALIVLGLILALMVHGQPRARYVLIGMGLLALSALVGMLQSFGYLPLNLWTENCYRISMLFFLLVMNYAISRRYQELRREKEAAQFALLTAARDAEQKLEQLVTSRTGDLQQAMQQVEHALVMERVVQRRQRQFLTTVSHEIRTPLAVIDAAAQNLARELQSAPETIRLRLEKIEQAASRLSSLFDDYAGDARFEGLSHGINLQWTALGPMLQDAADAGRMLADGHRFEVDQASRNLYVCCDPDLMRLILRTLADNAVKYTPPGTRIIFSGAVCDIGWTIHVRDEGPGISAGDQSRIFEKYYRGEAAAERPGTGLGLSLGRRLAEMQGGTLTLDNTAGRGSSFRIWLPGEASDTPENVAYRRSGRGARAAGTTGSTGPAGIQSSDDAGPKNS